MRMNFGTRIADFYLPPPSAAALLFASSPSAFPTALSSIAFAQHSSNSSMTRVCFLGAWLLLGICFCSWIANAHINLEIGPQDQDYEDSVMQQIASELWMCIENVPGERVFGLDSPTLDIWNVNVGSGLRMNVTMERLGSEDVSGSRMKEHLTTLFLEAVKAYETAALANAVSFQIKALAAARKYQDSLNNQLNPPSSVQTQPSVPLPQATGLHIQSQPATTNSQLNLHPNYQPQSFLPPSTMATSTWSWAARGSSAPGLHGSAIPFGITPFQQTMNQVPSPAAHIERTLAHFVSATEALVGNVKFPCEQFIAQDDVVRLRYTVY